ncbi:hypothetical protein QNM99_19690 [Pseudomonas sp. PCH446]
MRPSFYEPKRFPKLKHLADNWEVIREEFLALDAPTLTINRVGKSITEIVDEVAAHMEAGGEYGWLWGWGDDMDVMPSGPSMAWWPTTRRSPMPRPPCRGPSSC